MDLEYILKELGEFGKYQTTVYFLLFFPLVFSAMGSLSYVFTAGDINYRCRVAECDGNNTVYEQPWLSNVLPFSNGKLINRCKRYKPDGEGFYGNCSEKQFFQNETERCRNFIFENNENTITKEFNLLCEENNWLRSLVGTLNNVGTFIGMPLGGIISDRFGRKTVVIFSVFASSVMGTFRSFSTNYYQFVIFEMLDALVSAGIYCGIFILGVEITGPKYRGMGGIILSSYYSIGEVVLGVIVWLVDDWRTYLRIVSAPGFLMIFYIWIMPESLRWLVTHGKKDKAVKNLKTLASFNGKPISEEVKKAIENLENTEKEDVKSDIQVSPMKEVLRSKIMLGRVLNCCYCWITNTFVFYGLSLSSVAIAGNKYFNFILVSFIEIPAYVITWLTIDLFGRKISLSMALIVSGISCTMFHFIDEDMENMKLIMFLIGKCSITVSFTTLYVASSEIFPTNIRHSLMGFCSTIGRFGSMTAPQMPMLAPYVDPVLVFGAASFVSGALTLYFPETLNCKLPDTIEEAEALGKSSKEEINQ